MCKKPIYLVSLVVVLSAIGSASADLVAHWRLDETSGATAYDSSGNGNDGTLNGNPQWEAGMIGGALHLNGSSDYVRIPFSESLRVLNRGDFTLTLWLNADAIDKKHIVFQQMDLNGLGRSWLTIGNGNADNAIRTYVGGAWTVSGFVIEAGEWYHAAVVVTEGGGADSIQVYVNGEPQGNPRQDSMEDCEGGLPYRLQQDFRYLHGRLS
ncbi:MAG: LamG domain-containing protein [Phycisphaerae bacterium]|nr:LamG domain-containing protein [Phycisphaerae bacterium]